jgi:DNA transformation protein
MDSPYPKEPGRLRDLRGFGPESEKMLAAVGINTIDEFMAIDPYALYRQLRATKKVGLNCIYAIIGARENMAWLEVARTRRTEILMRLDDMGLPPR